MISIQVKFPKAADELRVAEIMQSWPIENIRQLIEEMEATLESPAPAPASPCGGVDRAGDRSHLARQGTGRPRQIVLGRESAV